MNNTKHLIVSKKLHTELKNKASASGMTLYAFVVKLITSALKEAK